MSDEQMRGELGGSGLSPKLRIDRRKLQRALGEEDVLHTLRLAETTTGHPADVEPGDWRAGLKPIKTRTSDDGEEQIPHLAREIAPSIEDAAISKFMEGGQTLTAVEKMFSLRKGFLGVALRRRYTDIGALKKALVGQSLENSLILQEYAICNIDQLSPAQALLGAKITAETAVSIEKSDREAPKAIDFGALSELGAALMSIEGILRGDDTAPEERADGLSLTPADPNPVTKD